MKPNKPEISSKWWSAVKSDNVDVKGALEKAFVKAEKAIADQSKKSDDAKLADASISALKSLAIGKAARECDKKKDKDLISGLKQLEKMVAEEIARLQELLKDIKSGDVEDDDDEGKLFDKDYRGQKIKQLRSGKELYCAFGFNKKDAGACDLLLHAKKNCTLLWKALKKCDTKYEPKLMVFGMAKADPQDKGKTLLIELDVKSKTPPEGVVKKIAKVFFKNNKDLKFKKIRIQAADGTSIGSDDPDEEVAEGAENTGRAKVTPEQKDEARREFARIEAELRRMAAENNISV